MYIYTCTYICMCIYIYIYIHMYIYIYIYTPLCKGGGHLPGPAPEVSRLLRPVHVVRMGKFGTQALSLRGEGVKFPWTD